MGDASLQGLLEPVGIPLPEPEYIKDNLQVRKIFVVDIRKTKWLNELAQRIRRHLFERLIERLQLRNEAPIFFAVVRLHPHMPNKGDLHQATEGFRFESIRQLL